MALCWLLKCVQVALETDVKSVRKIPLKHLREPVLNRLFGVEIDHLADQVRQPRHARTL